MQVIQSGYMTQVLKLQLPGDPNHWGKLTAHVSVTQPSGYTLELDADLVSEGKRAEIPISYPLMDDGAWEQVEGMVATAEYEMGVHTFVATVLNNGSPIVTETIELDQDQLYAKDSVSRLRHDFPPGFIECAPLRPVCIDHDEVPVTIRLKRERVSRCRVRMDITARHGTESLIDPIELDLTEEPQIVTFQHPGWERGEYWIRVQLLEDGQPYGPYMVRKFWKEVIGPQVEPEIPLRLGSSLQYMVDDWLFEEAKGIDFWPMSYDPNPDKPAVVMDKPWEYGTMTVLGANPYDAFGSSLTYDDGLYRMEYTFSADRYRRRGFDWHLLADDLYTEDDESEEVSKRRSDPMQAPYEQLLQRLLDNGTPVQEFDIPPYGCSYALLRDLRPSGERNTDHLMLAVPGIRPDGQLPEPGEFDESEAQIFEMYPEDLDRPDYVCLATSKDGVDWEKPELGRVEFHGSTTNNILGTVEDVIRAAKYKDVTPAITLNATTARFKFRMYDPDKDGPVDMDKVFMALIGAGRNGHFDFMWPNDFEGSVEALGFTPTLRSYYPMMYKGDDEYLFLKNEPLIYLGTVTDSARGMDLMNSSEAIRHQVELRDGPTIYWYYRPTTPPYPPQCMVWDNLYGPLRNLAVMWTNDGVNFHKRLCIGCDEFDPLGMQFYNMGLITELPASLQGRTMLRGSSSAGVAVDGGQMYVAELRSYPSDVQQQYPELIWTRDLLHWYRFTHNRAPLVKLGEKEDSYNWGMYHQSASYYPFKDADGNDAWWLSNTATSSRHLHYGVGSSYQTLEKLQADRPHYSESPFFVDWETLWQRGQRMRDLPFFTHIRPGRLAYAAPVDGTGELTTHPILFDEQDLVINAQVEQTGSLRVEVLDQDGHVVDGYGLSDSDAFAGDEVEHRPSWNGRRLSELSGRSLKFRIVLEKTRLFTLHVE